MKEILYLLLDKEKEVYLEFEEGRVLSRNDITILEYHLVREHQRGFDKGFSEGEQLGHKAGKDEDDPSKEDGGKI